MSEVAVATVEAPPLAAPAVKRGLPVSTILAMTMLVFIALVVVVVPLLGIYHPLLIDLSHVLQRPFQSWQHPLGTDALGRDELSRIALAARESILISVPALALNIVIGTVLGLIAGYFGRISNGLIMGFADLLLAIPIMILLIMVVAVLGPNTTTLILLLGLCYWARYARMARVVALTVKEREFVQASKTFGGSSFWIIRKHLFSQLVSQLVIVGSFDLGVFIILEASLSYLGLGIQPPTPSLGQMIAEGQTYAYSDDWLVLVPSVAIFLLVGGLQILSQRFTGESGGRDITRAAV